MDLLEDAEDFLGAALDLLRAGRWSKVCLCAQQCAEMALKAALNSLGIEMKGHDLSGLLEELSKYVGGLEGLEDKAKILDQYYIPTRYANAFYSGSAKSHYTESQARDALRYAEEIFERMKRIVAKEKAQGGGGSSP